MRFYRWDGPWLSLGRHQRSWPSHWNDLAQSGQINLVRRPSGGQAVLHAGGLTYALIGHRPHGNGGRPTGRPVSGCSMALPAWECRCTSATHHVSQRRHCFARSTAADLVDAQGVKRVGSAQRWLKGRLLQHGEILLNPPQALWKRC